MKATYHFFVRSGKDCPNVRHYSGSDPSSSKSVSYNRYEGGVSIKAFLHFALSHIST